MAVYNDKNHPNKSKEGDVFTIRMVSRSGLLIFNITFVASKKNLFLSKFKRFSEIASIDGARKCLIQLVLFSFK